MRSAVPVVIASLLLFTIGSYGTEENPELVDPEGDVDYSALYVGARDHDWLDLTGAWFVYQEAEDVLDFVLRVVDTSRLDRPSEDWLIYCTLRGDVFSDGEYRGQLELRSTKAAGESEFASSVVFNSEPDETVQGFSQKVRLAHEFRLILSQPGFHTFSVSPGLLRQFGDEIRSISASCLEEFSPVVSAGLYANGDLGQSDASFSFVALRRTDAAGKGDQDPEGPNGTAGGDETDASGSAAGASLVGSVFGVTMAAGVAGRRAMRRGGDCGRSIG